MCINHLCIDITGKVTERGGKESVAPKYLMLVKKKSLLYQNYFPGKMVKFLRKTIHFLTLTVLICCKACFHKK